MPDRFYLVTFDLKESHTRQAEYLKVRSRVRNLVGRENFCQIVKQCCMVRTSLDAASIRNSMKQVIGERCNILVVRLRKGYAFKLLDPAMQRRAREFLGSIEVA